MENLTKTAEVQLNVLLYSSSGHRFVLVVLIRGDIDSQVEVQAISRTDSMRVEGGESSSMSTKVMNKAGLGVSLSTPVASVGVTGSAAWGSMDTHSSGMSEISASREITVYTMTVSK